MKLFHQRPIWLPWSCSPLIIVQSKTALPVCFHSPGYSYLLELHCSTSLTARSEQNFPSVIFLQQFWINCIRHVVTVMLSQMQLVCYNRNAVLNSLKICVLNTQICVAGKIMCWSEWVSWFNLGFINKITIFLALEILFFSFPTFSHSLPVTNLTTSLPFLLVSLFLFYLMMSCPGSICNVFYSGSLRDTSVFHDTFVPCSDFGFATPLRTLPDSPEEACKYQ